MAPRKTTKPKETPEEKAARKAVKKAEKKASDLVKIAAMHVLWQLINNPAVTPEAIAAQAVATCGIDYKYIFRKKGIRGLGGKTPLQLAIMAKRFDVAKIFVVTHSANVVVSAMRTAIEDNNLELVRLLVEDGHFDLTKRENGWFGSWPLQIAMKNRLMPIVDYLYSKCPLPGTLQYAIDTCKDIEMVKFLLSKGCDVNEEYDGRTALSECFSFEIPEDKTVALVLLLIKSGAELKVPQTFSGTLLHFSSQWGWPRVTKLLINLGLPINALDSKGRTPLAVAIDCYKWSSVMLLINAGADVNVSWQGTTALHLACAPPLWTTKFIMSLLDNGANVNAISEEGETPLTIITKDLSEYDDVGTGIAVALLEHGADPNIPSANSGETPLHRNIPVDIAQLLIEKGANINAIDKAGNTPLLSALRRLRKAVAYATCRDEQARILLFTFCNADLTVVGNNGDSAANYFAELPSYAVKVLLEAGHIRLDSMNEKGLTPFHQSLGEDSDKASMCIEYGANTSTESVDGTTALYYSACRRHVNDEEDGTLMHLIDAGAEVHDAASDRMRMNTPLMEALIFHKPKAALYMLANGADYLSSNAEGETALHFAAMNGYLDVVKILVAQGAPINSVDVHGRTPLKYASSYFPSMTYLPRDGVIQFLIENGGVDTST